MFTIRAKYTDTVEVMKELDIVRAFFLDATNFVDLMPDIEHIYEDAKGIVHWKIRAEVPLVGTFAQKFAVVLAEETDERVEWMPAAGESRNLLRYAADFFEKSADVTLVNFTQMVELRRRSAHELHLLAGVAGEAFISGEMTKRITETIRTFIRRAKEKLEG